MNNLFTVFMFVYLSVNSSYMEGDSLHHLRHTTEQTEYVHTSNERCLGYGDPTCDLLEHPCCADMKCSWFYRFDSTIDIGCN